MAGLEKWSEAKHPSVWRIEVAAMAAESGVPKDLARTVQEAAARGDWKAAAQAAGRLAGLQPDDPKALYVWGMALLQIGQVEAAANTFERALLLKPDYEKARAGLEEAKRKSSATERARSVGSVGETLAEDAAATARPRLVKPELPGASVGDAGRTLDPSAVPASGVGRTTPRPGKKPHAPRIRSTPAPTPDGPRGSAPPRAPSPAPLPALSGVGRIWRQGETVEGLYHITGGPFKGGMGAVYLARHTQWNVPLAIKSPHESIYNNEASRARYIQEAETWIALDMHPNIIGAYYVRDIEGIPRFFVEAADGGELADWIKAGKTRSLRTALDIAIQVCRGMDYVHKKGLVHRDIKPANVLMMNDGTARVNDFGLGKILGAGNDEPQAGDQLILASSGAVPSLSGRFKGTPEYGAPEQFVDSRSVGPAADVYAFGMILLELLFGRYPFRTPDFAALPRSEALAERLKWCERTHRQKAFPDLVAPLVKRHPELGKSPVKLRGLLGRVLAKSVEERAGDFTAVEASLKDLYADCAGEPYDRPSLEGLSLLADGLNNRAVSYLDLASSEGIAEERRANYVRQAEAKLREALSYEPSHLEATFNLALQEWRSGQIDDRAAARRVAEAAAKTPSKAHAIALACQIHLARGNVAAFDEAALESCLQTAEEPEAAGVVGMALAAKGRYELAERALALALKGEPRNPWFLAHYLFTLQALGRDSVAQRVLAEARQQLGEFPESLAKAQQAFPVCRCVKECHYSCAASRRIVDFDVSDDLQMAVIAVSDNTLVLIDAETGETHSRLKLPRPSARDRLGQLLRSGSVSAQSIRFVRFLPAKDEAPMEVLVVFEESPLRLFERKEAGWAGNAFLGHVRCIDRKMIWTVQTDLSKGRVFEPAVVGDDRLVFRTADGRVMTRLVRLTDATRYISRLDQYAQLCSLPGMSRFEYFGPDAPLILIEDNGRVLIARPPEYRPQSVLEAQAAKATRAALDPSGHLLLIGNQTGGLVLADLPSGRTKWSADVQPSAIVALVLKPEGRVGVSRGKDDLIRVSSLDDGLSLRTIEAPSATDPRIHIDPRWTRMAFVSGANRWESWSIEGLGVNPYPLRPVLCRFRGVQEMTRLASRFRGACAKAETALEQNDLAAAYALACEARAIEGYEQHERSLRLIARLRAKATRATFRSGWQARLLSGRQGPVHALTFAPETAALAGGGADATVRLWDVSSGRPLRVLTAGGAEIQSLAFDGAGAHLLAGDRAGHLHLWDVETGQSIRSARVSETWVTAIEFSPDGALFLAASGQSILLFRADTWARTASLDRASRIVNAARFGPGDSLLAGYADGMVLCWDWKQGRSFALGEDPGQSAPPPDSRAARWKARKRIHGDEVTALALSPDRTQMVSAGREGKALVWDLCANLATGSFAEHGGGIFAAAWFPLSSCVITAGGRHEQRGDTALRLWSAGEARGLRTFEGHEAAVLALAVSSDGRFGASADEEGLIRIWEYDWNLEF